MNFESLNFNQTPPKSGECKKQLNILRLYFMVWLGWNIAMLVMFGLLNLEGIGFGLLLLFGMLHLNDQFLAIYSFLNIVPFIVSITFILDKIFSLGKSTEGTSGSSLSLLTWIVHIVNSLIMLAGVKITYDSFKVFRAERLGFPMDNEFDLNENLSKSNESAKPFSGKGTKVGGSTMEDSDSD